MFKTNYRADAHTQSFIAKVFGWMFLALLISSLTAMLFAGNKEIMQTLVNTQTVGTVVKQSLTGYGCIVALMPLVFGLVLIFGYDSLSETTVKILFLLYSVVNGISFSFIISYYTASSLTICFVSAAAMFGIMAVFGYTTKKDLTSWGNILLMALIGLIIVNILTALFIKDSKMVDYIIGSIGVIVFSGLTAFDVQNLKNMAYEDDKSAIMGAFSLYLDFVNLFLYLLKIFGNKD